jgi:hypothetical protein
MALVKGGKGYRCGLQIRRAFRLFLSQRLMWKDALPPLASRCVSNHFDLRMFRCFASGCHIARQSKGLGANCDSVKVYIDLRVECRVSVPRTTTLTLC